MLGFTQNNFLKFHLPAILWTVLVLVASLLPDLSTPEFGIDREDLIFHFFIYSIFGVLLLRSLKRSRYKKFRVCLVVVSGIMLGTFCEVAQKFVPGRYFEIWDLFSNWTGVIISSLFFKSF